VGLQGPSREHLFKVGVLIQLVFLRKTLFSGKYIFRGEFKRGSFEGAPKKFGGFAGGQHGGTIFFSKRRFFRRKLLISPLGGHKLVGAFFNPPYLLGWQNKTWGIPCQEGARFFSTKHPFGGSNTPCGKRVGTT